MSLKKSIDYSLDYYEGGGGSWSLWEKKKGHGTFCGALEERRSVRSKDGTRQPPSKKTIYLLPFNKKGKGRKSRTKQQLVSRKLRPNRRPLNLERKKKERERVPVD